MKSRATVAVLTLLVSVMLSAFGAGIAQAQTNFTVDSTELTLGYMNVFDLVGDFQFGSGWGLPDLTADFAGSVVPWAPTPRDRIRTGTSVAAAGRPAQIMEPTCMGSRTARLLARP